MTGLHPKDRKDHGSLMPGGRKSAEYDHFSSTKHGSSAVISRLIERMSKGVPLSLTGPMGPAPPASELAGEQQRQLRGVPGDQPQLVVGQRLARSRRAELDQREHQVLRTGRQGDLEPVQDVPEPGLA